MTLDDASGPQQSLRGRPLSFRGLSQSCCAVSAEKESNLFSKSKRRKKKKRGRTIYSIFPTPATQPPPPLTSPTFDTTEHKPTEGRECAKLTLSGPCRWRSTHPPLPPHTALCAPPPPFEYSDPTQLPSTPLFGFTFVSTPSPLLMSSLLIVAMMIFTEGRLYVLFACFFLLLGIFSSLSCAVRECSCS